MIAGMEHIAYFRVSTDRQGKSGLGLDAQRALVERHIGAVPSAEFVEVESGKRSSRPQLHAAIAECKRVGATLIVAKLDRLARNVRFLLTVVDSGVPVIFCDLPHIDGPVGKFMLTSMAAVAELEAGMISQRTKAALAEAKKRGVVLGKNSAVLSVRNREAALAHAASVEGAIRGLKGMSRKRMAEVLNEMGVPTAGGGIWHRNTVDRVLKRLRARP
jgi:DNA invertase Pin-like site-specific DNA recombinase